MDYINMDIFIFLVKFDSKLTLIQTNHDIISRLSKIAIEYDH